MNILIANHHLSQTGGTENYTYALAIELKKLGHNIEYFTFIKGFVSDLLEKEGINFRTKRFYDLIIANHNKVVNYLRYNGYIIQTCHGIFPELEQPSKYADEFVAVTEEVQKHLEKQGISSTIILNGIDCNRFFPTNNINSELKTVLSVCQSDEAHNMIKECCDNIGLNFLILDKFNDNIWKIEELINKADLVIGIGRSLYDAMACGRAVLSFDKRGYSDAYGSGYLNFKNIDESIKFNCSGRDKNILFTTSHLLEEIKKYNSTDGVFFRNYALENLNIEIQTKKYLEIASNKKLSIIKLKKIILFWLRFIKKRFNI